MVEDISSKYYKRLSNELFEKHSLAALIILLNIGFELEFCYKDIPYSITQLDDALFLSSPKINETQTFGKMEQLVIKATIDNQEFIEIWDEIVLTNLF